MAAQPRDRHEPRARVLRAAAGAPHRIRIIGGAWKRTPLPVPDIAGLRPTPDRVRETLFNWIGADLSSLACLDLFAGTGALGLEAASRGAASVWLVESDRQAARSIAALIERLQARQVRLLASDALAALGLARREAWRFDLVFLDPPFGQGWLERVAQPLGPVLAPAARIYVETGSALAQADAARLFGAGTRVLREGRAGRVFYHLLQSPTHDKGLP